MRFISKSAIVIKTEKSLYPTSTWHHYPLALTCFEDLRLNSSQIKGISVSASSGVLCRELLQVRVTTGCSSEVDLHAVESSSVEKHVLMF